MKNLEFKESGNRLEIVGLTEDGKAYVESLKVSSRRIKPGAERFVIKAFQEWVAAGRPTAFEKAMSKDISNDIADAIRANAINTREQIGARNSEHYLTGLSSQLSSNAEAIIAATTAAQKRFGKPIEFKIIDGTRDGQCTVTASAGGITGTGRGLYFKMARASAARDFLSRVK